MRRISGFFISLSDILNQKSETSYQVGFYAGGVQTRTEMLENAVFTFTPATKKISDTVYEVETGTKPYQNVIFVCKNSDQTTNGVVRKLAIPSDWWKIDETSWSWAYTPDNGSKYDKPVKIAVEEACVKMKEAGARRALVLPVGGAFHSPLMEPARKELAEYIETVEFHVPECPIYQNVTASATMNPVEIKTSLLAQLTSPVRWTQTVKNMVTDGALSFVEVGPGTVLQGLISQIASDVEVSGCQGL